MISKRLPASSSPLRDEARGVHERIGRKKREWNNTNGKKNASNPIVHFEHSQKSEKEKGIKVMTHEQFFFVEASFVFCN